MDRGRTTPCVQGEKTRREKRNALSLFYSSLRTQRFDERETHTHLALFLFPLSPPSLGALLFRLFVYVSSFSSPFSFPFTECFVPARRLCTACFLLLAKENADHARVRF